MQLTESGGLAVILAGGQGRRIGGDKARVMLAGRPLWQHVAERLKPQVARLAVNGTGAFGAYPVIADVEPGLGPLGGVLTAMDWAAGQGAAHVLTVAVDTPFLPGGLRARLAASPGPIAMAQTADGLHGTTALWDVGFADNLRTALAEGTRKVTDWTASVGFTPVAFPDQTPPAFFNINTSEDLAQAEAWLA